MDKPQQESPAPAASDPLAAWSEEDRAWYAGLPTEMKTVAARHGRFTFNMVLGCGTATECIAMLMQSKPPAKMLTAIGVLNKMLQQIATLGLSHAGVTAAQFNECKADMERAALLSMGSRQQGEARSAGGIILNG